MHCFECMAKGKEFVFFIADSDPEHQCDACVQDEGQSAIPSEYKRISYAEFQGMICAEEEDIHINEEITVDAADDAAEETDQGPQTKRQKQIHDDSAEHDEECDSPTAAAREIKRLKDLNTKMMGAVSTANKHFERAVEKYEKARDEKKALKKDLLSAIERISLLKESKGEGSSRKLRVDVATAVSEGKIRLHAIFKFLTKRFPNDKVVKDTKKNWITVYSNTCRKTLMKKQLNAFIHTVHVSKEVRVVSIGKLQFQLQLNAEEDTAGDEDTAGGGEGANDALVQGEKRYTVDISAVSPQLKENFSNLFTKYLRRTVHDCGVSRPNADQIIVTCRNVNKKAIKNLLHNFMKPGKYGRMKISVPQNSPSALELQTRD